MTVCPSYTPADAFRWPIPEPCLASRAMKNFFTSFFASLTAMIVFVLGAGVLCFLMLAALAAMGQKKPIAVLDGSYLVFDLSANIQDTPSQAEGWEEFAEILGGESQRKLQLREVT